VRGAIDLIAKEMAPEGEGRRESRFPVDHIEQAPQ
jgi:hypothetical protein